MHVAIAGRPVYRTDRATCRNHAAALTPRFAPGCTGFPAPDCTGLMHGGGYFRATSRFAVVGTHVEREPRVVTPLRGVCAGAYGVRETHGTGVARGPRMRRITNTGLIKSEAVTPQTIESAAPPAWTTHDFIAEPSGPDWGRIRTAIVRRRWLILASTAAALAVGFGLTRVIKPQYVVQSMIWIDQDGRRGGEAAIPGALSQSFDASAWSDLVRTAQVLDTVVAKFGLNVSFDRSADSVAVKAFSLAPTFTPGEYKVRVTNEGWTLASRGQDVASGARGDSIAPNLGFQWVLPPTAANGDIRFSVVTPRDAARQLGEALDVKIGPEGNFLRLTLSGENSKRTADVLNAVGERYVAVAADLRRQKVTEVSGVLGAKAAEAAGALRAAENAFEAHRVRAITLPSDAGSSPTMRGAGDGPTPSAALFAAQNDRESVAASRTALDRVAKSGTDANLSRLDGLAVVERDPELSAALRELATKRAELRTLAYHYSDAYPPVVRLQEEIDVLRRTTIPALAGRAAAALGERQGELDGTIRKQEATLRELPRRAVEESRLRRNVEIAQDNYTDIQARYTAARLADESTVNPVRILDQAVAPELPDKNVSTRILLIALFAGLSLSVAGAVGLDRVDPRVRYPTQVANEMGLTVLGALPHLNTGKANPELDAPMVEALRGVRLNLAYALGTGGPVALTISSPGSADGKSFLSSNLARTFAESGQRTILIDGDLRRGALHQRFGAQRRPGLTDYLHGREDLKRIVHHTKFPGLDLIPGGTRTFDAPELLGRVTTAQLLAALRQQYDVIIVDSPPLTAGIDAFVLGAATGNLMMVLRAGQSMRGVTESKLEVLDRMPVRLLGAVLNDVRDRSVYNNYSYYTPGYEAADEVNTSAERVPLLR
jgi:succinoglycan biosynthesis transport protein ExoP